MKIGYRASWYACSLAMILSWPHCCPADEAELLSLVRAGHRSARQSIHSLSATVTRKTTFADRREFTITGKYWRSLDVVRVQKKQGAGTDDTLLKDSEIRQVGRSEGPQRGQIHHAAVRRATVETLGVCDVWCLMRIDFAGPSGGRYDFDRFLEFAQGPIRASRDQKEGHKCVRLRLKVVSNTGVEQNVTLWHDEECNYLVRKMTVTYEKTSDRGEIDILDILEPLPGVFVPSKCRQQSFRDGKLHSQEETTLSEVQVNKPIPSSVFQLPAIPAGTILNDHIRSTRYPVDESWRAIGPAEPLPKLSIAAPSTPAEYHSQSTSEAKPLIWWIAPGSLLVLAAAGVCFLYRQYRFRRRLRQAE